SRQRQAHRDLDVHSELRPQAEQLRADLLHVFPDLALFLRGTEKIGGMESGDDSHAVNVGELPAQSGNGSCRFNHGLRRESGQTANDFGTDYSELLFQEWIAGRNFIWLRIAVFRKPALQDVANVDLFTLQIDRFDDLRQKLARAAHKRQTLLIFVVSRRFADEY